MTPCLDALSIQEGNNENTAKLSPLFTEMRGFYINCSPVLSVAIDENVTAIEGYELGGTGIKISQEIHQRFLRGNKAMLFCFIIGNRLNIWVDFLAFLRVSQIELMMEDRNVLIRRTRCNALFYAKNSPLSGDYVREWTGTLLSHSSR